MCSLLILEFPWCFLFFMLLGMLLKKFDNKFMHVMQVISNCKAHGNMY